MDKKKKLHTKVMSLFLSLLMVLSTILGYIPASAVSVQAAANGNADLSTIKQGTDITKVDGDFDPSVDAAPITFKFNKKGGYSSNFINKLPNTDYKGEGSTLVTQPMTLKTKDGQAPWVMYYHVAYDKITKQWYNIKVTFKSYKKAPYKSLYKGGKEVPPFVSFSKSKIGFYMEGIKELDCDFQWYLSSETKNENGTFDSTPMGSAANDFRSYVTLVDLDAGQSFSIKDQAGLVGVYKYHPSANAAHITQQSDGRIQASTQTTTDKDNYAWVMAYLKGTDKFSLSFFDNYTRFDRTEPMSVTMMYPNSVPFAIHYGFKSQTLFTIPPNPNIPHLYKRVGEKGCTWDTSYDADSKDVAYEIEDYEPFDYIIEAGGPGVEVETYEVTDTLEACLTIDDSSKVKITDKNGKNVTGNFDVSVKGQTIRCTAKADYLETDSFKESDQFFDIQFTAHRRKDTDVRSFMGPWLDEDGYTFYVPNTANVTWHSDISGTKQMESNECWVTDEITSRLAIEKDAKYDDWKVGDKVTYAVEVTQIKQDGYATNVVITDEDIPSSLKLLNNEWTVSGPNYGEAASISSSGTNGWIVTCPLLMYGDSIKIEFKCLATEAANGKDTINTAYAMADNFLDEDGEQMSVGDSAEVWVNSPVLTVDKTANAYEYELGDDVRYTVTVNNTADYTIAENVVVSDITLPEGLELQGDINVDMGEAKTSIGWPVKDGTTTISKETRENVVTVEPETTPYGNSWTVKAKYLPSQQPMQITFNCKATKAVNGVESQNVVTATADNFLSLDQNQEPQTVQDDAEVYVNTAAFDISKTTPDYEWQVGDHVPFDITVRNINDEGTQNLAEDPKYADLSEEERAKIGAAGKTVARNVVITDKDIPEGFILDFDTVDVGISETNIPSAEEEVLNALEALGEDPAATDAAQSAEEEVLDALEALGEDPAATDAAQSAEEEVLDALDAIETETSAEEDQDLEAEVLAELQALGLDEETAGTETVPEIGTFALYAEGTEEEPGEGPELPDPTYPDVHDPRPAEPMTVTGIPDSYDDHIPGTKDLANHVDEQFWNETEPTPITWELLQEGNGWKLLISDLPAGHDVNVHFTCEATQAGNGQEGVNIGTITADNAVSKSDDSEAYVNTATLSIDKQLVNKYAAGGAEDAQDGREDYEFRVGEDVEYKLILNNTQKGSIARNVVVSDVTLPEGLTLDMGSITVEGLPEMITNPIAGTEDADSQVDPDHYKETEILPVNYEVVQVQNGFQVMIDNLPCTTGDDLNQWNQPVVITYHCVPEELVNGFEIVNTGKAAADNAGEVKDTERIWINSPVLNVSKNADRNKYLVGDTITYQVDITQDQIGCLAREIVVSDVLDTPGVKLQKNSIVLIDSEGYVIQPVDVEIKDNNFIVHTGLNLVKDHGYTHIDLDRVNEETGETGRTEMGDFNPVGIDKETKITLEYAVEIVDNNLAGQSILNTVEVNSKENIPDEDQAEVPVYGPALDIEKVSDKAEYQVGEDALYKLTIRNIREDTIVKQVVVEDGFEKAGMEISGINVRLNGKDIKVKDIVQDAENHFLIHTGIDMNDTDKLEVFYKVVFTDPELHDQDIINVAMAQGENTDPEYQDNCVRIVDNTPGLSIEKSSDKQEYKVGDTGHYKVVVTNTEKGTTARNVIIKDELYVDGAKILYDTLKVFNDAGKEMDDVEAERQGSDHRYTIYTGHDLEYKEQFTVTYDVLFEEETLAGQDILNIARATCDNLRVETEDPAPITLPNGLTIHKSADPETGSVVKNGEPITYHIRIVNDSDTDMKNVLVKDRIPEHTVYISSEEQEGVIAGTRTLLGKEYATFVIENLKAGEERTVSFQVMVADAPEEEMIFNVAQVRVTKFDLEDMNDDTWNHESFRNTNEVVHYTDTRWIKDENIVHIDNGRLGIEKVSDKTNYSVGETGHYTVTVNQKVKGAVARNVVVSDKIQKAGAYIQKDSIKAYILREGAEEEEEIQDIHVTAKDYEYTVNTNTNLKYGDLLLVRYDVLFKEASLEGQQIKNTAMAKDDETPEGEEPTDDNRVTVGEAGLIIEKTSDKQVYEVGEIGKYVLKVTCSDPSRKIENVVVKDVMKQQGTHLVAGTVRTYYDNEELKVDVQEKDNGFVVETNHDLSGTHVIWVKYDVVFESPQLVGRDIENIATTWGDNTTPTDDEYIVYVPGEPGGPETPTPSPEPEDPTPTPEPEVPSKGGMTLTKTANKHVVSVGDTVSYTLTAKVNSGTDTAKNVVITDSLDPDHLNDLELIKDSIRSYIDNAEFHGEALNVTSSGFTLKTGKDLAPNQVIKVTYDVKVKSDRLAGKTFKNIAGVSSDNMDPAKDTDSVIVKTDDPREGGMTLTKSVNKPQVQVGDTVAYTLEARVNSGTDTAKNVVIKDSFDSSIAKYVEIKKDSFRCYIDNTEFQPKSLNLTNDGFSLVTGKDLKAGQVLKVTYDVLMKDPALKGKNVKNSAVVSSDNMEPGKDNEVVIVEKDQPSTGGLDITKSSDHSRVNVGDTVKYTLTVKTTSTETAKNVVIKDTLDDKAVLEKNSVRVYLNDQMFTPKKLSTAGNGFHMETGKDLKAGETMKVVYDVRFADESLGGKTVKNTAVADSDNTTPSEDSADVEVNKPAEKPEETPALSIDKVVNLSKAEVGDTLTYVLTVKETVPDMTAKNVTIKDRFNVDGLRIKDVRATLDGKAINAGITETANGVAIETGKDLAYGSVLKITYQAVIGEESLAGSDIRNTASASADNAAEVSANATTTVDGPEPTEIPDSELPEEDVNTTKPDDTTNTIGPKTGLTNNAGVYAGIGIGILAIAAIAVYVMRRKRKK